MQAASKSTKLSPALPVIGTLPSGGSNWVLIGYCRCRLPRNKLGSSSIAENCGCIRPGVARFLSWEISVQGSDNYGSPIFHYELMIRILIRAFYLPQNNRM
ncbi:uncharacterized protein AKAW2_50142S [Aspergillus luchuensis]|uniref:Uncharacterized protein n=1 Tax=Aspergillus kawachii TaxID=1069201 RepID=A0A7R7ZZ69_ASPKA|nr:uncharacterized protein AKAW2_50142S [Aspergillus luchuensis]BCR99800.1 hypothetical protein AKAW2_50142S [Aspergillus luchuensis]